jgi:hypothetical protein
MPRHTAQTLTLRRALRACGGLLALAGALNVSAFDLFDWLHGYVPTPTAIYITAMDLAASGRDTGR